MESANYEVILDENRNMIFSIINDIKNNYDYGLEYSVSDDDLFQEGCIALYIAYKNYKDTSKAKFSTYAYLIIRRRVQHKFREYVRPLIHEKYSYDSVRQVDYFSDYGSRDVCESKVDSELFDMFIKTLDATDMEILQQRRENITYKNIARNTNLSIKQVDYRMRRMKEKFRIYLKKHKSQGH